MIICNFTDLYGKIFLKYILSKKQFEYRVRPLLVLWWRRLRWWLWGCRYLKSPNLIVLNWCLKCWKIKRNWTLWWPQEILNKDASFLSMFEVVCTAVSINHQSNRNMAFKWGLETVLFKSGIGEFEKWNKFLNLWSHFFIAVICEMKIAQDWDIHAKSGR